MRQITIIKQFYRLLNATEKKQARLVFFVGFLTALTQAMGLFSLFPFLNVLMDPTVIQSNTPLSMFYQMLHITETQFFIVLGILVLALMVISSMLSVLTIVLKVRFVLHMNHELSLKLLTVYTFKPYAFLTQQNNTEMAKNILDEVNHLTGLYLAALFEFVINGLMLVLITITLLIIHPLITILATLFYGTIYILINKGIKQRLSDKGKLRLKANKDRYQTAYETLTSIKSVKINRAENYFINTYKQHSSDFAKANTYALIAPTIPRYLIEGIAFSSIVLFIIYQLSTGQNMQTIIPLIGVLALAGYRLLPSIQRLFQAVSTFHYKQALRQTLYEHIQTYPALIQTLNQTHDKTINFKEAITLNNVSYTHPKSQSSTIKNINLTIKKNTITGIIGTTGSGKSTLIDVIIGLNTPHKGSVNIDQTTLKDTLLPAWFDRIGYVPQTIDLIDDTIIHNIAFGIEPDAIDLDRVQQLIHMLDLDTIQARYNQKQSTIGNFGIRLSGGEKQRIGIARALYKKPDILILDEATNAIDLNTERQIFKHIQSDHDYTIIIVSHRPQTLKYCQEIIALEKGQIVKTGTYDQLLDSLNQYLDTETKV